MRPLSNALLTLVPRVGWRQARKWLPATTLTSTRNFHEDFLHRHKNPDYPTVLITGKFYPLFDMCVIYTGKKRVTVGGVRLNTFETSGRHTDPRLLGAAAVSDTDM